MYIIQDLFIPLLPTAFDAIGSFYFFIVIKDFVDITIIVICKLLNILKTYIMVKYEMIKRKADLFLS